MGKSLKGRELGVGISQRKDGFYTARFTSKQSGKLVQKYFRSLPECKNWYADARLRDESESIYSGGDMTVNAWFNYWIKYIKGDNLRFHSMDSYKRYYHTFIKGKIGNMRLSEVKPFHCQNLLVEMSQNYTTTSIRQIRFLLFTLFESALENDLILKNPVTKNVKVQYGKEPQKTRVLTKEEQKIFLEALEGNSYYEPFAFILQTGLRVGELIGLKWSDIDWDQNILHVQRNMIHKTKPARWEEGKPKTKFGDRFIPLTPEACTLLQRQMEKNKSHKHINIQYADFIFLTKNGNLTYPASYNQKIKAVCKKYQLEPFSIHALRHTFATRCMEAGIQTKTLQGILGHSSINMTMDLYVHSTEEQKQKEMRKIQDSLKIV